MREITLHMHFGMAPQVRGLDEPLAAEVALVGPHAGVDQAVRGEVGGLAERAAALLAAVGPVFLVDEAMRGEALRAAERFVTFAAPERPLAGVDAEVHVTLRRRAEGLATDGAEVHERRARAGHRRRGPGGSKRRKDARHNGDDQRGTVQRFHHVLHLATQRGWELRRCDLSLWDLRERLWLRLLDDGRATAG